MPDDRPEGTPMKHVPLSQALVSLFVLSLAGCFGGADEEAGNPLDPGPAGQGSNTRSLSPGLYTADYSLLDTARQGWESEFTLDSSGGFRHFLIVQNEPVGDTRGRWIQRDSNLFFSQVTESYMDQNTGFFPEGYSIEDDTNAVREITDTSFIRKEWTLLRQKPYWVAYRKKSVGALEDGTYEYARDVVVPSSDTGAGADTADTVTVRIRLSFDSEGFLYSYNEDTLETFQAKAQWYQFGSVLATEENSGRSYIDSLGAFDEWSSIPGALLQRIRMVSDTSFQLWSPGSFFTEPAWDEYRRVP
jgi:hypothetical protein